MHPIPQYVKAITSHFSSHNFTTSTGKEWCEKCFMSCTEANMHLPLIVTCNTNEERMGHKGTSWDEETLISEEIKPVVLAILKLCLCKGISKLASY